MSQLVVLFGTETAGYTVTIDGRVYRPPLLDSSGRLLVALALPNLSPFTVVVNGQDTVTAAGTAEQLPTNTAIAVTIKALPANTGNIFLGDSAVSSANGHVLGAGDAVNVAIDNLNRLWIDSAVNGEGVSWLLVR